ncbi:MAG: 4-hydroxy-tetrahydrodipicolinate reductase [Planctomycetota bacterium]|nr:4-hydroxy-tetrahydrodipicolinate reductase [Planctomycetota bacterium]
MSRLRVAVLGASGRLGRFACELLDRDPDFEVVARASSRDDVSVVLRGARAEVVFESTAAGLGAAHARLALEAGARPLVATSGVTPEEVADLDAFARSRGLGGLYAPNLSRGMWLLQRMAEEAARHVSACEIVELHHDRKRDAPSGTAADTARRVRAARAAVDPASASRDVPIHSVRLPGLLAHQEVLFGSPGELLTLRHDALSAEAYGPGIRAGLRYVAAASGFRIGIGLAFEAPASP